MKNKTAWFVFPALVMSLALVSCTHKPYHPTKSDREWAIDHEACEVSGQGGDPFRARHL